MPKTGLESQLRENPGGKPRRERKSPVGAKAKPFPLRQNGLLGPEIDKLPPTRILANPARYSASICAGEPGKAAKGIQFELVEPV